MNCGRLDWIHVSALERMSGSDANAELMTRDSCPPIWLLIMPMPATSAAASAPMPRNLMKFPGAKNLVMRLPMVSRPDWSLPPAEPMAFCSGPPMASPSPPKMLPNAVLNGAARLESLPVMALVLPLILESVEAKGSPSRVMASRMVLLNSGFVLLPMAVMALPSGEVLIFPAAVARPLVMASPICPVLVLMPVAVLVRPVYRLLFSHLKARFAMPGVSFVRMVLNMPSVADVSWLPPCLMRLMALAKGSPSMAMASRRLGLR